MRKQNSTFKTAFISEAGSGLENNDYFAYVELDQYACYVIADGLNDLPDSKSARLATQAIILAYKKAYGLFPSENSKQGSRQGRQPGKIKSICYSNSHGLCKSPLWICGKYQAPLLSGWNGKGADKGHVPWYAAYKRKRVTGECPVQA